MDPGSTSTEDALKQHYEEALDDFVEQVKADNRIIAIYVYGDLVRDCLWRRSRVDVLLVTNDERQPTKRFSLIARDVLFDAHIYARRAFREMGERMLRGSEQHAEFAAGRWVYTTDQSLADEWADITHVGDRDRQLLVMRHAAFALYPIYRARKELYLQQDPNYSFIWMLEAIQRLARVETALNGCAMGPDAIKQALAFNPDFFTRIYVKLLNQEKNAEVMEEAIRLADDYLLERAQVIFKPILDYLAEAGEVRTASELDRHFGRKMHFQIGNPTTLSPCLWMATKGIIQGVNNPAPLTPRNRVMVSELAYYYDGGE